MSPFPPLSSTSLTLLPFSLSQEKILQEGAMMPLLSLANCDNGDRDTQRYGVLALNNLCATRANHPQAPPPAS